MGGSRSRDQSRARGDVSVGRRINHDQSKNNMTTKESPLKDRPLNVTNKVDMSWADDKCQEIIKYFKKFNLKKDHTDKVASKYFPDAY